MSDGVGSAGQVGSRVDQLPSALSSRIQADLAGRRPAVFLDYDGTLTPIVPHPSDAVLAESTRSVLARLAGRHPVAVISGRDRADVQELVGLDDIYYAGSHGFDMSGPGGFRREQGSEYRDDLERAADGLDDAIEPIDGAWVERKRFAVCVHFRQAAPEKEESIRELVRSAAESEGRLRMSGGKKIYEVRPDFEWDKGKALISVLEQMGLDSPDVVPLYLGDDETDEDAFRVLPDRGGIGIVVGIEERDTLADYSLADPDEVRDFLAALAGDGTT